MEKKSETKIELKKQIKDELLEEIKDEVEKKSKEQNKSKNIIIGLLLIIIAVLLFFIGYNWMDKKFLPMDKVDSSEEVVENDDNDDIQDETIEEVPVVIPQGSDEGITDAMKSEMKRIGMILDEGNQIGCGFHMLLMGSNKKLVDFTHDEKLGIVTSYVFFNDLEIQSYDGNSLTSDNYYKVAKLYGFTESYENLFGHLGKDSNGNYFLPVTGCTAPTYLVHNVSFVNGGNTITMINDMKIVDSTDNTEESRKVIYTFTYNQVNNGFEFVLNQVNFQ